MSNFSVKNNTNSKTNTLTNTLRTGATTIPGYTQAGAAITGTALLNSTIEGATTGYSSSGVDIGSSFSARYIDYIGPASGTLNVANYSSCTLVMCGGGGGGAGGTQNPTSRGNTGGDGGIAIFQKIPVVGVTNINYSVGAGGALGLGFQAPNARGAQLGTAGQPTSVAITPTTYRVNSGGGGRSGQPAVPGPAGTITPAPVALSFQGNLNGPLAYESITDKVITISGISYGQGGAGGNTLSPTAGNSGVTGRPGFLRIYLYP